MTDNSAQDAILAKVTWRVLPFLVLGYTIYFIDRINPAFAGRAMIRDLGFSAATFGIGAGSLFIALCLFGLPSNLFLARWGARRWLSSIMVAWGLASASMVFVDGEWTFYIIRFIQGAADAGFFPGVILYLTFWFPERRRASVVSGIMFAQPIAMVLAAVLSGWLLGLDGVCGLTGWQWMFLVEGLPAVALGVVAVFFLTDRPSEARWLRPDERAWLLQELETESARISAVHKSTSLMAVFNARVALLCVIYLVLVSGVYGVNLWMPQILFSMGALNDISAGLLAAIPFIATSVGILVIGWSSDRFHDRMWHLTGTTLIAGLTLIGTALVPGQLDIAIILLSLSSIGIYSAMPIFWTVPPTFLTGRAIAAGIALINAVGNLGGFVGPYVVGLIKDMTGSYLDGLFLLGACVIVGGLLAHMICRRTLRGTP